jgi:uncharacterized RDD family membrane protein YckC
MNVQPVPPNPYIPSARTASLPLRADAPPFPLRGVELALPGFRLLARIIDNAGFYAPIVLVTLGADWVEGPDNLLGLAIASGFLFLAIQCAQIMLIVATGATIGKRIVGIKMIRHDGEDVGFLRGWLIRTFVFGLLETILGILFFWIPNLVDALMVFTRHGQTLHDRMAGTYVVKAHSAAGSM